jgi:hypothetical protein
MKVLNVTILTLLLPPHTFHKTKVNAGAFSLWSAFRVPPALAPPVTPKMWLSASMVRLQSMRGFIDDKEKTWNPLEVCIT